MQINQNKLAKQVTLKEGLKEQVSIAQVKEILGVTFSILANEYSDVDILRLIKKYRGE